MLTRLEKCQFFGVLNLLFLSRRKAPILRKKEKLQKWPFLDPNPLEKCQFFDFLNFYFLKPKKAFF